MSRKTLGLVVNPIAGMGGRVGLKGTDGADILEQAIRLGAVPRASSRTVEALIRMRPIQDQIIMATYAGDMGENEAVEAGFQPQVIGAPSGRKTSSRDTQSAVKAMQNLGTDLILFAGGDGTARDICTAVNDQHIVLGIPAGVKIHSACFAASPLHAGDMACAFLTGKTKSTAEAEVMDLDEEAYRREVLKAKLFGYVKIPFQRKHIQGLKAGSSVSEKVKQEAIAAYVVESMTDGTAYFVGPGTTTRAIMERLGIDSTLLGVDLIRDRKPVGLDLNEARILEVIRDGNSRLIITPVGGQGVLLGRGNQQLSPEVVRRIGKECITIVATPQKIADLRGRPLLVDTGDAETDIWLSDYYRVVTGYGESAIYRVSC